MADQNISTGLEPAKTVTEICGGVHELARLAECSYAVALRFSYPKEKNGGGGVIPAPRQFILLRNARAEGIDLRPEHFFPADVLASPTPSGDTLAGSRPVSAAHSPTAMQSETGAAQDGEAAA